MSQSLSATLAVDLRVTVTDTGALNSITAQLTSGSTLFGDLSKSLANGTSANQATKAWYSQRTLASAASETIDLSSLTDRFGAALAFTKLKWVLIRFTAAAGKKIALGGAAANAFQGPIGTTLEVAEELLLINATDGWTVDATHKNLKVENTGSASVTYDICLLGHG